METFEQQLLPIVREKRELEEAQELGKPRRRRRDREKGGEDERSGERGGEARREGKARGEEDWHENHLLRFLREKTMKGTVLPYYGKCCAKPHSFF